MSRADSDMTTTIEIIARECAEAALQQGAEARELLSQEDAFPADYQAVAEAVGRDLDRDELRAFRRAYSNRLAEGSCGYCAR